MTTMTDVIIVMMDRSDPVIIEESLVGGELHKLLKSRQFKVRTSSTTPYHSCMFPMSSVVCMIGSINMASLEDKSNKAQTFIKGMEKSLCLHYRQYVFLLAPLFGSNELSILTELQERYLKTPLQFIPIHNNIECLEAMIHIVKIGCWPACDIVKERYVAAMDRQISDERVMHILKNSELTDHEVAVAVDGCGSLQSLANADLQKMIRQTSLEKHRSALLINFLSKK